jgi:hypothetical protein
MKPGLWESSTQMNATGEAGKAMAEAQKQLASLPPEQRKMMESMMAQQGVGMGQQAGNVSLKFCLTKEMADRNDIVTQQGDCKHSVSPRSANSMKFSFVCSKPASKGEGQVTFVSPEAYTMIMNVNSTVNGKPETITMNGSAKFLATECGKIKPFNVSQK